VPAYLQGVRVTLRWKILHEADIIAMKARPPLFDAISGLTGRGTTEDAESRTSSPRPMYRRLLTAASSQPGRHPQGHTIDVKLRPTFDQSSPLHVAVKQALGSKTDSALELPRERNRHLEITQISSILWLVRFMKGAMEMLGHDDNPHHRYSDQF